jgi:hypothetical protein
MPIIFQWILFFIYLGVLAAVFGGVFTTTT